MSALGLSGTPADRDLCHACDHVRAAHGFLPDMTARAKRRARLGIPVRRTGPRGCVICRRHKRSCPGFLYDDRRLVSTGVLCGVKRPRRQADDLRHVLVRRVDTGSALAVLCTRAKLEHFGDGSDDRAIYDSEAWCQPCTRAAAKLGWTW